MGNASARKGSPGDGRDPAAGNAYDDWVWLRQAEREFLKFPEVMQGQFIELIERVLNRQTRPGAGDVKPLGNGILELRDRYKNNQFRVLWFVHKRVCIALTCFYKSSQSTEKRDLDRANERRKAYLKNSS